MHVFGMVTLSFLEQIIVLTMHIQKTLHLNGCRVRKNAVNEREEKSITHCVGETPEIGTRTGTILERILYYTTVFRGGTSSGTNIRCNPHPCPRPTHTVTMNKKSVMNVFQDTFV